MGKVFVRKPFILAMVGAVLVMLVVVSAVVLHVWNSDNSLREKAEQVDAKSNALVKPKRSQANGIENSFQTRSGDGVIAEGSAARYWACGKGVYRQALSSSSGAGSVQLIVQGHAACLNVVGDTLYYLATADDGASFGTGTQIGVLDNLKSNDSSLSEVKTRYRVDKGVELSCLSIGNDSLYFIESKGKDYVIMSLACEEDSQPQELKRSQAEDAWLFVEDDNLFVVLTTASSWSVDVLDLAVDGSTFKSWMRGTGRLQAACMSDGALFYALSPGQETSHLCRRDAMGSFAEYDQVDDAVRLAADGDVVAAVTRQGDLLWTDIVTGFSYDASTELRSSLGSPVPFALGLSVEGSKLYCAKQAGDAFAYDVNTRETTTLELEKEERV